MKLINKDALVAEIERLKKNEGWYQVGKDTADVYYARGFRFACERIISFLNIIEIKKVDLDFEQELYKAFGQVKDFTLGLHIAKHFFELGIKAKIE